MRILPDQRPRFSALQRAEIAETLRETAQHCSTPRFSALQRAEIAEIWSASSAALVRSISGPRPGFSALQRAEIAEI